MIGLGATGSAALYALAARGRRAVGFERFEPGHDRGSSHGESRIIRLSYHEDPSYVPLLHRAYEAWRAFERVDGGAAGSLLRITGILEAGHAGSASVRSSLHAARSHGLAHETLDRREIARRFPAFRLPDGWHGLHQPEGGYLRPEASVIRFVDAARRRGAAVHTSCRVLRIEPTPSAVRVVSEAGTVEAGSVIVAAGAWIAGFAPFLAPHLTVTRQVVGWFPTRRPELFTPERCPVFILDGEDDHTYGFPDLAGTGVKSASHVRGRALADADDRRDDDVAEDEARILAMFERCMPDVGGPAHRMSTCLYTRTADGHFLIDRSPDDGRVILASPCSGHGFKFASLFGQVLAGMADGAAGEEAMALFRLRDGMTRRSGGGAARGRSEAAAPCPVPAGAGRTAAAPGDG